MRAHHVLAPPPTRPRQLRRPRRSVAFSLFNCDSLPATCTRAAGTAGWGWSIVSTAPFWDRQREPGGAKATPRDDAARWRINATNGPGGFGSGRSPLWSRPTAPPLPLSWQRLCPPRSRCTLRRTQVRRKRSEMSREETQLCCSSRLLSGKEPASSRRDLQGEDATISSTYPSFVSERVRSCLVTFVYISGGVVKRQCRSRTIERRT